LTLALSAMSCVLFNHYCKEYPFIIGGKIMRLLGVKKIKRRPLHYLRREQIA